MKFYHISHKLVFLSFSIQIFLEVRIRVTKIYQIIYVNCLFLGVFCRCKRKCPTNLTLNGSLLRKFIQRVFKGVKHDSCWRLKIDLRNCDQNGSKILVFELLQRRNFLDFEDESSKQSIFLWHSTDLGKKIENRRQKFQKKVFLDQNQTSF